jgi:hypothetical protein
MCTIVRLRSIVSLTLFMALLLTGLPRATEAAGSPSVTTSTYQSGVWCDGDGPEKSCAIHSHSAFTLLQISGENFSRNGTAIVTVTNLMNLTTVSSGVAFINGTGLFLYKTPDVEICADGTPLRVQVYDVIMQSYTVAVTVTACHF